MVVNVAIQLWIDDGDHGEVPRPGTVASVRSRSSPHLERWRPCGSVDHGLLPGRRAPQQRSWRRPAARPAAAPGRAALAAPAWAARRSRHAAVRAEARSAGAGGSGRRWRWQGGELHDGRRRRGEGGLRLRIARRSCTTCLALRCQESYCAYRRSAECAALGNCLLGCAAEDACASRRALTAHRPGISGIFLEGGCASELCRAQCPSRDALSPCASCRFTGCSPR